MEALLAFMFYFFVVTLLFFCSGLLLVLTGFLIAESCKFIKEQKWS